MNGLAGEDVFIAYGHVQMVAWYMSPGIKSNILPSHRNPQKSAFNVIDGGENTDTVSYETVIGFTTPPGRFITSPGSGYEGTRDDPARPSKTYGVFIDLGSRLDDAGYHIQPDRFLHHEYQIVTLDPVTKYSGGSPVARIRTDIEYYTFKVPNGAKGDKIKNVENVTGSNFIDVIKGDAGDNHLSGLGGDDILEGRGGRDVLTGGAGRDTFIMRPESPFYGDIITDFEAGDRLHLDGHHTNRINVVRTGNDTHITNNGYFLAILKDYTGDITNSHFVNGGLHIHHVPILGDSDNNHLVGTNSGDIIDGGPGRDIMTGGPGNDVFIVRPETNPGNVHPMIVHVLADRITDYSRGDKLDVRGTVGNVIHARRVGDSTVQLANNRENIVLLENYDPAEDGDIVFTNPALQLEWT